MDTFLNDILIDQSTEIPRNKSFQVTSEPIQSSEYSDITTHVKSELPSFSLTCRLKGDDREERFTEIEELAEAKGLVKIMQDFEVDNLVITGLENPTRYQNIVEFIISFQRVSTITFQKIELPASEIINTIQNLSSEGLQQVQEVEIPTGQSSLVGG